MVGGTFHPDRQRYNTVPLSSSAQFFERLPEFPLFPILNPSYLRFLVYTTERVVSVTLRHLILSVTPKEFTDNSI